MANWISAASNLVKVDMDEDLDERAGVNRPGFTLHGGVLRGRADVNCAVHVHTRTGMAIAGLKGGLKMISQEAVRFHDRIGYHPYEGITEDFGERERLIAHLGNNRAMIMHNHGVLTVGKTAREAFILMKHLLEAAEIQLAMEATGGEVIEIPRPTSAGRRSLSTKSTTVAAAPPTGRPTFGCSIGSIRAIGTDGREAAGKSMPKAAYRRRVFPQPLWVFCAHGTQVPRGMAGSSCTGVTCCATPATPLRLSGERSFDHARCREASCTRNPLRCGSARPPDG
jgi:ribulose-5-phosphate 4-epimerase/fuculose-1-phosphate aldolase